MYRLTQKISNTFWAMPGNAASVFSVIEIFFVVVIIILNLGALSDEYTV